MDAAVLKELTCTPTLTIRQYAFLVIQAVKTAMGLQILNAMPAMPWEGSRISSTGALPVIFLAQIALVLQKLRAINAMSMNG